MGRSLDENLSFLAIQIRGIGLEHLGTYLQDLFFGIGRSQLNRAAADEGSPITPSPQAEGGDIGIGWFYGYLTDRNSHFFGADGGISGEQSLSDFHLPGQDFIIAMATAKGHSHPVSTRTFECHACGAVFLLAPEMASLTCSYCASVYVIEQTETHHLLPPESIIPFSIDKSRASQIMIAWSKHQRLPANIRLEPLRGLYFPAWSFTISGPLPWNSLIPDNNDFDTPDAKDGWKTHSGMELVAQDDILVPGSQTLQEKWSDKFCQYDLDQLVPYDPAFLADWPAESYQISLSDASLEARSMVLEHARSAVKDKIPAFHKNLYLDSKDLMVETFKLILLPLWISHFRVDQKHYPILINGQTGKVWGRKAGGGVIKWFSSLFKDE